MAWAGLELKGPDKQINGINEDQEELEEENIQARVEERSLLI